MKDALEHNGYPGSVRYSADDHVLYGKVTSIRSLITFEGTDVASLEKAFVEAVDDDLAPAQRATGEHPWTRRRTTPRRTAYR